MSRTPSGFKQTDITKALKAVHAAGYSAARVLLRKDGDIEVTTNPAPAKVEGESKEVSPLDQWKAGRGQS